MVRQVFRLVYKEIRGLHQAAYVLALFALASQMLALVRDRLLAHTFGAGAELDIYYAAFRIPDLLYVLFASSLSVYVLIPFVTDRITSKDAKSAQSLLSQVATVFLWSYSVLALAVLVLAPYIVPLLAPGLEQHHEQIVMVMRILLLQPLFLGLSSLCGVVTQIGHRFVLYALSPLVYNIGIIVGITALYPLFGLGGLAAGVVLGAVGHMLVQVPLVQQSDLAFRLTRKIDWQSVRSILKVSIPRALTLSIQQIALVAFISLASLLAVGSVSVFQFAYNLQSVPLAMIGASYSVAAFPLLAKRFAEGEMREFRQHVLSAIRHIVFWSVPIVALVIVLRAQLVRVVLGSGAFDWSDTRLTAAVLVMLVISLVAQAVNLLVVRTFYAGGRTYYPLFATAISAVTGVGVSYALYFNAVYDMAWFVQLLELLRVGDVVGAEVVIIAIGFSVMTILQSILLLVAAARIFRLPFLWLWLHSARSLLAALVGGIFAYGTITLIVDGVNQEVFIGIFIQGLFGGLAGIVGVVGAYYVTRSPELREIARSFKLRVFKTDVLASQEDVL